MLVLTPGGEISTIDVPDMLPPMLRAFSRSAIEENPSDLPRFAANYFAKLAALSAPPSFQEGTPSKQDSVLRDTPAGTTVDEMADHDRCPASSGLPVACSRCGIPCSHCRIAAGVTGGDLNNAIGNRDAPSGDSSGHSSESREHQPAEGSYSHVHATDDKNQETNRQGRPERASIELDSSSLTLLSAVPAAEVDEADLAAPEGQPLASGEVGDPVAAEDTAGGASFHEEISPADDTDGQHLLDTAECEHAPLLIPPIPFRSTQCGGNFCFI